MSNDEISSNFLTLSPRLAFLSVPKSTGDFGVFSNRKYNFPVGFRSAPLYEIVLPFSPVDDKLVARGLPAGQYIETDLTTPEADEWQKWSGSRSGHAGSLLPHLPPGNYYLIRSTLQPRFESSVLMGNELVPANSSIQVLLDQEPFWANIIGPSNGRPPHLTEPLLGVPVLNYTGMPRSYGVLFFPFSAPQAFGTPNASSDLFLILPASGSLILNTKLYFQPPQDEDDRREWQDNTAVHFAKVLSGS